MSLEPKQSTIGRSRSLAAARPDSSFYPAGGAAGGSNFVLLVWLLAAASLLSGALDQPFVWELTSSPSQLNSLVSRATGLALGLVAAYVIFVRLGNSRPSALFGLLALMWGILLSVSFFLDGGDVDLVRPLILLLCAMALSLSAVPLPRLLWHVRLILRTYLAMCFLSIFILPEFVWRHGRDWLGTPQFASLPGHPNALWPIAALALLLELTTGGRRFWRWTFGALALAALVLAQSRGGWAAGVLVLVISALVPPDRTGPRRTLLFVQCGIGLAIVAAFAITDPDSGDITNGRWGLWTAILNRGGQSWLFGSGLDAFSDTNRSANGFARWAGEGHNQFMDSFFTGGLVEVAPLAALVVVCVAWSMRSGPQRRTAIGAVAILFVALTVEAPLRPALATANFVAVMVLAIVTAHGLHRGGVLVSAKLVPVTGSPP